ncbi:FAD-dependent oxidoreductase [Salinisphaera sp. USBA-960]|uniref:FAD/NAD(P)-binding protein n=1 Tax=Salinisphaera orenii TaxID=856731 RepID=UPI000DBE21E7|nr:FAD-dependent oxidoreductase [Salifodinibacter halophilus]NNC25589.1 FAD-dependent oxidoreductase [Salifodinibacter halophilus]
MHKMWDWLIIGGGIHGAYAAATLTRAAPEAAVAILDPRPPLAAWRQRANACGMTYLRSPGAHHLGARADSLRRFAAEHGYAGQHSLGVYQQPSRALFEHHADTMLADLSRIDAAGESITRHGATWLVDDNAGDTHQARRVVLATGPNGLHRPLDAPHVFDAAFELPPTPQRLAIVGGGLSAARLALHALEAGHAVRWLTRKQPRQATFDSDPCFAGPKCLTPFQTASLAERRRQLIAARNPGTLPPSVYAHITAEIASGAIDWRRAPAPRLTDGGIDTGNNATLAADVVVQATGLTNCPDSSHLLGRTAAQLDMDFDADGNLEADDALQIAPGLHVVGRPASLVVGPMAPNIRGARMAAERLATVARSQALAA